MQFENLVDHYYDEEEQYELRDQLSDISALVQRAICQQEYFLRTQ